MTVLLCALAIAGGCSRGGASVPVPPARGSHAELVIGEIEGEPVTRVSRLSRFASWVCIHGHEAPWNDANDPYWGGLQMDRGFMRAYGSDMIRRHHGGLANVWTPAEQIIVAERAYDSGRGFGPWPNTARDCGLPTTAVA